MIKKLLFSAVLLCLIQEFSYAQCTAFTTTIASTQNAPTVIGNTITANPGTADAGRRNFVVNNMVSGATYRVSTCGAGVDTQLTIFTNDGLYTVVGYNDDNYITGCATGNRASYDFSPPATGSYRMQSNQYNCLATGTPNTGPITVTLISNPPTSHCIPPATTANGTYINRFSTTGGTPNITNNGSGWSANGYADNYPTMTVGQFATGTVNFSLTMVGGTAGIAIWVDWNKNFVFDAAERVYSSGGYVAAATYTGTITVPSGAALGDYRMRVKTDYLSGTPDPCTNGGTRVETEDYKFTVIATPPCAAQPTSLTSSLVTSTTATISWVAATPAPSNGYQYYVTTSAAAPTAGTTPTDVVTVAPWSVNLTSLTPNTTYYFWVRSNCGALQSGWAGPGTFVTPPTPPANDLCVNATTIACGTANLAGTTIASSNIPSVVTCGFGMSNYGVWYTFVGNGDQVTISSTASGGFDQEMAILSGASCGALTSLDCQDAGWTNGTETSTFIAGVGVNYYVYIAHYSASSSTTGNFTISMSCIPATTPPNDLCSGATPLPCGTSNLVGTTQFTTNTPTTIGCSMSNQGVWYTFVGNGDQTTIVVDANFDAEIGIATGSCGALTNVACNDTGNPETYTFITTNGVTYYVYVAHWLSGSSTTGNFTISRSCTPVTPPPNDLCSGATPLVCGDANIPGNTSFASNTPHGLPTCGISNIGVWYTFTGTGQSTTITATPNASFNLKFAVVRGSCGSFTNVAGSCTNAGGNGVTETFTFNTVVGLTYYVYVAAPSGTATGSFTMSLSCCSLGVVNNAEPSCGVIAGGLNANGADPAPINCSAGGCVDLEAQYIKIGNTTSYRVEQIPYNPPPNGALVPVTGLQDDYWSNAINFPGSWSNGFCFYGTSYSQFLFGANGMITFNVASAGQYTGYTFNNNIPSAASGLFNNTIYGVYQDIDPSKGGTVGRTIDNTPGCERMIIVWDNVPMYYSASTNGSGTKFYSGKMVLYKNTNIIEVYIQQKVIDDASIFSGTTWNDGNAIVGLQNTSTDGIAAPCRNALDPNWTVTNEAWRFVPNGNVASVTSIAWHEGSGTSGPVVGTTDVINVCPTATTTYTAEVTYNPPCGPAFTRTDEVVVTVGDKVWNGSVDTNWYLDTNWTPPGVPVSTDCVVIPNIAASNGRSPVADIAIRGAMTPPLPPVIATAKNVSVRNSGSLQVNAGTYLEIVEGLNVQANGDVLIRDTGSLVQVNDVAVNNNTGNIRMQRTVPGVGAQNYVYWSAPVEGFNVGSINTAASEQIYQWEPTTAAVYGNWTAAGGTMTVGRGYIVRGLASPPPAPIPANSAQFTGRPNNGIITVPITRGIYTGGPYPGGSPNTQATNIDDNWNLVGNPYPSAISASDFIATNNLGTPKIDGTIYLWQHAGLPTGTTNQDPFYGNYVYNYLGSSYVATNGVGSTPNVFFGSIAAGQSFFVQMLDGVSTPNTLIFNNAMRSGAPSNDNFLRTGERHRIWLDLINSNEDASSTLVGYVPDATNDRDLLYDGYNLNDTSMQLYTLIGSEKMIIQGRALPFDQEDRVPLGFIVPQTANYKIAINNLDGIFSDPTQNVYLEDTYLNSIIDLRIEPYNFTSNSGTFNDRFILRYTNATLSTPEQVANFGFNIIGLKDYIKVSSGNSPINTVMVYDVLGRVLADYKDINLLDFKLELPNQSKGTLIVKATLYNGQQKIKKVIY